jgi:hypothetical protein
MLNVSFQIFTDDVPFFELKRDATVMSNIKNGDQPSRPPASSLAWTSWGLTDDLWLLMQACWDPDPDQRPTIQLVSQLVLRPPINPPLHQVRLTPAHLREPVGVQDLLSVRDLNAFLNEREGQPTPGD